MSMHKEDLAVMDQTADFIEGVQDAIEGGASEVMTLSAAAGQILAMSIETHRAGRLGLSAWLIDQAGQLAMAARAVSIASQATVPDDASGLE